MLSPSQPPVGSNVSPQGPVGDLMSQADAWRSWRQNQIALRRAAWQTAMEEAAVTSTLATPEVVVKKKMKREQQRATKPGIDKRGCRFGARTLEFGFTGSDEHKN